ncbi:MAG: glycosyltransferase family 9 protein [bacterium]|nr:glycosyltransferase family 9 protein [bacterium]
MKNIKKRKVLIIKTGYTEILEQVQSNTTIVSLGDIFRTTAILHLFKNDEVTWLVDEKGIPLLKKNPYINRILIYNLNAVLQLQHENYDIVINLEKNNGICALSDSIKAWQRYGFRFDPVSGETEAYEKSYEALYISNNPNIKRTSGKHWLQILYEMLGREWKNQNYILGYKPRSKVTYDIGFNIHVGSKWPNKAWSLENWKKLESMIRDKYSYIYQQHLDNIEKYVDWINSCRMIITNDSLALHLAIFLGKKIIVLFGPTYDESHSAPGLVKLEPRLTLKCRPCMRGTCKYPKKCIDHITPELVYNNINRLFRKK